MIASIVAVCSDAALASILSVVKRVIQLIQIIVPILLIISASIKFTEAVRNPDDKKILKKIFNSFFAAFIVFIVPVIVNAAMSALGEQTTFSNCWNYASDKITYSNKYVEIQDKNTKETILINPSTYEKGEKKQNNTSSGDFSNPVSSCGSLEYCNKYLTSLYNNSKKLNDAILKNNASVEYSNSGDPQSWEEAISVASRGQTVKISCNRPSHWSMSDITGE